MTRRAEIEPAHHLDEGSALPLLKPGIVGQLRRDGRMAQTLIVMRRIDQRLTIQLQQLVEKAVIKLFGVASRKIGTAGPADQQRIAGKDPVFDMDAHGVARVRSEEHTSEIQSL